MNNIKVIQTLEYIGQIVTIYGWVQTKRDHGKITFIDLRDKTGYVQCVGVGKLNDLTPESVVEITGTINKRPEKMINKDLSTGTIEIEVESYKILNLAQELPIPVDSDGREINEEARLKYRYLDLRRDRMAKIVRLRSNLSKEVRSILYEKGFTEVETPILTQSTKEGSRDFVVPSRHNPGRFYALPQSPQQYKQLLMTAGVERYFQFARCIRDEDLRADRGYEHTQIDLEMSFMTQQQVMQTIEEIIIKSVKAVGGVLKSDPFPVVEYKDALKKYGADKFDLRTKQEKEQNILAFAWVINFPFFKKVDTLDAAEVEDGKSGYTFTHNPFSSPIPEHLEWHLKGEHIEEIVTAQYDLVCNGYEVGGGSIRAHTVDVLKATYKIMGYSDDEIQQGIGHMLQAFSLGTPPHGGIGLGLDRLVMILAGEESLKEAIAFPMTSSGRTSVMSGPSEIEESKLEELHIKVVKNSQDKHTQILNLLKKHKIQFELLEHQEVHTSEDAAKIRDTDLSMGAKALIVSADNSNLLIVVPADKKLDLKKFKQLYNVKDLYLVSPDDVFNLTGLKVGSIPPLGSVLGLECYYDNSFEFKDIVVFNAASLTKSIKMAAKDLLSLEKPQLGEFSK